MTPEQKRRKQANDELLARMKDPDDALTRIDIANIRWAPRKIIEKDRREMARLYGEDEV